MSGPAEHRRKASKGRWHMPLQAFSYTSQLEVITVIANCGNKTELAAEALVKYIESKQRKGRTEEEVLKKLELLEIKFLPFTPLHVSFQAARRATGLPPSMRLSPIPVAIAPEPSTPSSSHTMQQLQSASSSIRSIPLSTASPSVRSIAGSTTSEVEPPDSRSPTPILRSKLRTTSSVNAIVRRPRTAGDRGVHAETRLNPSPLRPAPRPRTAGDKTAATATEPEVPHPVGRLERRHSLHISPPASPTQDGEPPLAWTLTQNLANLAERRDRHLRPSLLSRINTREQMPYHHRNTSSQDMTPTSGTASPMSWTAPGVAFAPPPNLTASYTPDSSTPSRSFIEMDSRPSTSASHYTTDTDTPSVTSFQIKDAVRQSATPKVDPELLESLFSSASAETFLRLFRG